MLPISVLPSLPAHSFKEIQVLADALRGVSNELQVDIVDGKYVPLTSWPFTEDDPSESLLQLEPLSKYFDIEMDCMVLHPEQYLDQFVALGAKRVIVHVGSTSSYSDIIAHARTFGYKIGFAFTNDTSLDILDVYKDDIDYVQLMGIAEVGQQGQPFDERTLGRSRLLREKFPELEIAVDGSVNAQTIPKLYAAGVTRFAPGSAIAKTKDPAASYKHLLSLVA